MSLKETIIAALENLQGERIGLAGATRDKTIRDCIEVVRSIPEDDGWISVEERLPAEHEECCEGEKHTASDIVQVAVMDSVGNQLVSEDMLFDGKWVNYPWGDFETTHWMPLPDPPKEVG